jgi:hypothetical protein
MNEGKFVFAQLMQHLPLSTFRRCVQLYDGEHKVKSFSCLDQFLCMAFAQLTYRESLRDIETCLRVQRSKLYHLGFRADTISRNTLANANATRDWRIYALFAQRLIAIARKLYINEPFGVELNETVYALDSTLIDLCLTLCPWSPSQQSKAGVRLHTLLDLRGPIPSYLYISEAHFAEINILDRLILEPGALYLFDRGYLDFARLHRFQLAGSFFIIRAKSKLSLKRRYSHRVDRSTGLICDQTVVLNFQRSKANYPQPLRRIRLRDMESGRTLVLLTNHFDLSAETICQLYRCRWQIELFFKWIKQHLRIKAFYGISENAVKTQLWVAVSVYVLIAIIKKRLNLQPSLYQLLQILGLTMFERIPLQQLVEHSDLPNEPHSEPNQLLLFP